MNKINFALALALTFMAAVACDKNKVAYDMTDAARAAMDRLVGEYELVGAEWDGSPVDLNGDGVASASIFDELKEVPDLTDEIGIEIDMAAPYRTSVRISLLIEEIYLNTSIAFWNKSVLRRNSPWTRPGIMTWALTLIMEKYPMTVAAKVISIR